MKIPLAEMTRRATNTRRSKVVLPAIEPTAAQAADLSALYAQIIRVWARYAQEFIIPAYRQTLEQERQRATRDAVSDIQIAVGGAETRAVQATLQFSQAFKNWADRLVRWHLQRFASNIKYATNIDLSTMLGEGESAMTVEQAIARNVALVRDVSDTIRGKISATVFAGVSARTPVRELAKDINEILQGQKARSKRIASDQTVKMAAQLDRERLEQVGVDRFEWMHSRKAHPRKIHVARNGQVYKWDDPKVKGDLPGHAPFCGCKAKGVLVLDPEAVAEEPKPAPVAIPAPPPEPPRPIFAYQSFVPLKSVPEVKEWMAANVGQHVAFSKGVKLDGLNDIAHAAQEVNERFNMPKAFFLGDPTGITFNIAGRRTRIPFGSKAVAMYAPQVDSYVFRNFGTDDAKTKAIWSQYAEKTAPAKLDALKAGKAYPNFAPEVKAGLDKVGAYHFVTGGTTRSTAYHELGHRLHMKFYRAEIDAALGDLREVFAKGWDKLVSQYGGTNRYEFVAESFALYMTGEAEHYRIYPPLLAVFKKLDKAHG